MASIQFFKRKITQPPVHISPLISPIGLIEFSIQILLFSKVKFTCLPRNAGRLELTLTEKNLNYQL
jgi:hypothetical protein